MLELTPDQIRKAVSERGAVGPVTISPDAYHGMTDFISSSALKKMERTPSKFLWEMENARPPSAAMQLGTAIHMAILEPDRFATAYRPRREKPVEPERPEHLKDMTKRSAAGKAAIETWESSWRPEHERQMAEWERDRSSSRSLSGEDADVIERVSARVIDKYGHYFGRSAHRECSFFAIDPVTSYPIRGRCDLYLPDQNLIIDLKTTDTADEYLFTKTIFTYGYHVQAAFYCDLVGLAVGEVPRYRIIAAEKVMDCDAREFDLSANREVLEEGRRLYRLWLSDFVRCKRSEEWVGYPPTPVAVKLPAWVKNRSEDNDW